MKKILSIGIISLMLIASAGNTQVFAEEPTTAPLPMTTATYMQSMEISPRAEKTEWRYRIAPNGTKQRRLWSISGNKWLTAWENC